MAADSRRVRDSGKSLNCGLESEICRIGWQVRNSGSIFMLGLEVEFFLV